MSFAPSAAGEKLKENALTKAICYYTDGNTRTWYGRHDTTKFTPVDPRELEINRLKKYVNSVATKVRVAILYDQVTGQEIGRFKNGAWV